MDNPCCNCSEVNRKRPRCKSLKCPMYFEHLEEDKKFFAMVDKQKEIRDMLVSRGISVDNVSVCDNKVTVSIEDGDWYHDHRACDSVMADEGYKCIEEREYGEKTDDDSYSSEHVYKKL